MNSTNTVATEATVATAMVELMAKLFNLWLRTVCVIRYVMSSISGLGHPSLNNQ